MKKHHTSPPISTLCHQHSIATNSRVLPPNRVPVATKPMSVATNPVDLTHNGPEKRVLPPITMKKHHTSPPILTLCHQSSLATNSRVLPPNRVPVATKPMSVATNPVGPTHNGSKKRVLPPISMKNITPRTLSPLS
jgi:hypothetical protein